MNLAAVSTSYNNISIYTRKATDESTTSFSINGSSHDSDSILDCYHELCNNFPNVSFRLEDFETGSKMPSEPPYLGYNNSFNQVGDNFGFPGQCSLTIDKKVIEKMQKDTVYKEIVYSRIANLERQQIGFQQHAQREGMSCFAHVLEDDNGRLALSTTYAHGTFSTEEEVRGMWDYDGYQQKVGQVFEKQKADLFEIFLKMTEACVAKRDELNLSQEVQKQEI